MPCYPNLLASIKMFELLDRDDQVALARVVDEYRDGVRSLR